MTCERVLRRGPSFFVAAYQLTKVSVSNFEIWRFLIPPCAPRSNFNSFGAFVKSTCLSCSYDKAPYSLLEEDRIEGLRIDAGDLTHQASGVRDKMAVKFPNYQPCGPLGSIEKRGPIPTKKVYEELHQEGSRLAELWTEAQIAARVEKIGEEFKPCEFSAEKLVDIRNTRIPGGLCNRCAHARSSNLQTLSSFYDAARNGFGMYSGTRNGLVGIARIG